MDLTLKINNENHQQIKLKRIHDTTKVSTQKEYSKLQSASSKPKRNQSVDQIFLYYGVNKSTSNWIQCLITIIRSQNIGCANANIKYIDRKKKMILQIQTV